MLFAFSMLGCMLLLRVSRPGNVNSKPVGNMRAPQKIVVLCVCVV